MAATAEQDNSPQSTERVLSGTTTFATGAYQHKIRGWLAIYIRNNTGKHAFILDRPLTLNIVIKFRVS